MPNNYELQTDACTLKGLTHALDVLTWEGFHSESWTSVTALIRTINQQAKKLSGNLANLPDEPSSDMLASPRDRVRYFAEIIDKEPPSPLLSDDKAPSPELMAFCQETGMSLDWVFTGDLKAMALASHRDRLNSDKTA